MLEMLGVGVIRRDGTWLIRGVSARIDRAALVVVTGDSAEARAGVLDAIAGEVVPVEGRVWLGGVPVSPASRRRIRRLVHAVDLERVGLTPRAGEPIDALPAASRVVDEVAHALARRAEFLLLREADATGDARSMEDVATFLSRVVSTHRLTIVASARAGGPLHQAAHVAITLAPDTARVVVA